MASLPRFLKPLLRPVVPRAARRRMRMLLFLMGSEHRRGLLPQLAINVGLGIIEVLSVISVFPFLAVAAKPEVIHSSRVLDWVYTTLGFETDRGFLVFLGLVLLALLGAATFARIAATWANTRFLSSLTESLAVRLTGNYLGQPYPFFLETHTSNLHARIHNDVALVDASVLAPLFTMASKGIAAVMIFAALIVASPVAALIVLVVLGGGYGAIYLVLKPRLAHIGKETWKTDRERLRAVHECFSGIKVAKVMGLEPSLLANVQSTCAKAARLRVTNQLQQLIPVQAMEVAVFALIVLGTLSLVAIHEDFASAIPTLGLYALAAYRLKPSLQGIYDACTKIKKGLPRVDAVHEHLNLSPRPRRRVVLPDAPLSSTPGAPPPIIEFRDVSFAYPRAKRPTLDRISFAIRRNTTVGFRGPTGSGKTTLLDILLGLLEPSAGAVLVDGKPLQSDADIRAWQRRVGYVPQEIYLTDGTIAQNIAYGVPEAEVDHDAVRRAAAMAQIAPFIETDLPDGYATTVGERGVRLSGGQRQRVGIARALYHDPDVLVFDEATSALDNETEAAVMEAVAALAHRFTIIMVAHRLSTLECCDEVLQLDRGMLATACVR